MEATRLVDQKFLRCGFTTGSCATAAATAATEMLLSGRLCSAVSILTPKGIPYHAELLEISRSPNAVCCAVRKDSGDDPDITNGVLVFATVTRIASGIEIDGGEGIGRVTKSGLEQPIGAAAINRVPREEIRKAVTALAKKYNAAGGFRVILSIPDGEALAAKTFNPQLGIVGGLSILGTSGIVEPMSEAALVETIRASLSVLRTSGATGVILTPGNYGEVFCRERLRLPAESMVLCSNFIGDAIRMAIELGFTSILLVGHLGKLVKLGVGLDNTHSMHGDARLEALTICALEAGGGLPLLQTLLAAVTTDGALPLLAADQRLEATMNRLSRRIEHTLSKMAIEGVSLGAIFFANRAPFDRVLGETEQAAALLRFFEKKADL